MLNMAADSIRKLLNKQSIRTFS